MTEAENGNLRDMLQMIDSLCISCCQNRSDMSDGMTPEARDLRSRNADSQEELPENVCRVSDN